MSNRTREINKITTTIISISVKLIVYALIVLLLYEAVARGYAFGHEIFYAEAVDESPGTDMVVQIDGKESVSEAAEFLARRGLIKSEFAFIFQSKFYDYDTIYPGTYNLNTSMTSKEILQLLNEKPEDQDAKTAQSAAKAAPAKTSQGTEGKNSSGSREGEAAAASETGAAVPAAGQEAGSAQGTGADPSAPGADIPADEAAGQADETGLEGQANEQTYDGEVEEIEDGWIEDATEDGTQ